jgi:AcrR family transcriptional regulator
MGRPAPRSAIGKNQPVRNGKHVTKSQKNALPNASRQRRRIEKIAEILGLTYRTRRDNIIIKNNNVIKRRAAVSYSSEQTRKRILTCARHEFLKNGYARANLRRIADNAKATTGALYAHFKNKEELFDALVHQPADELLTRYEEMHEQAKVALQEGAFAQTENASSEGTDWMLEYIYEHFDAFKLIVCCSEGTAYSKYIDKLIEIEESAAKRTLPAEAYQATGDFFLHVISSSGLREMFEVVAHDLPKEEAIQYIKKIKQFRFGGWREILER